MSETPKWCELCKKEAPLVTTVLETLVGPKEAHVCAECLTALLDRKDKEKEGSKPS